MRFVKKSSCVAILLCLLLSATACSGKKSVDQETPYYSLTIDGVKQYKAEENEDVKKIKEFTDAFVKIYCNFDYKSMENYKDQIDYFTEAYRNQYIEYEYIESSVESIEYYEQVLELLENTISEIRFFTLDDQESAWVNCDYISKVTHATDEYFTDVGIKPDTKYTRPMTIQFVKENGEWKIEMYDVLDREEVQ